MPAWEGIVAAASATYTPGDEDRPNIVRLPLASNFAGFVGATSVLAALLARARDGLGQQIEVPLFDAMFQAIGRKGMRVLDKPRGREAPDLFGGGLYECADGRWVHFSTYNPRFLTWLADAADFDAWPDGPSPTRAELFAQPERAANLRARLRDLFRGRSSASWDSLGEKAGVPLAAVRDVAQWSRAGHARAAGLVSEIDDPLFGPVWQPGLVAHLSRTPGLVPRTAQVDDGMGAPWSERDDRPAAQHRREPVATDLMDAPPLAGVRVVDLTHVFAGPTAGRTLAEFGAEVVKIDNPRTRFILDHRHLNRAKRSVLLDLTKDRGQRVLHRLLSDADVLLHSFSSGAAERLGLAYDDLKARYPALIYAEISAYGGPGPWRHRRGYESQAQAVSGISSAHAQAHEPRQFSFALNDYGTGILTAFAIQLALIARESDGRGQRVSTSLAQTATVHQALALADSANAGRSDRPEQASELQGLYRSSDGWLYVEAHLRESPDLSGVTGLEGLPPTGALERERVVEERFASAPSATWAARLAEVGFGAHACVTVEDLMEDPWVIAHGLSITRAHEDVGPVRTIGPSGRLSRTPVRAGDPARPPGADGPEVLEAVGLSSEVAALIDARVLVIDGVTA